MTSLHTTFAWALGALAIASAANAAAPPSSGPTPTPAMATCEDERVVAAVKSAIEGKAHLQITAIGNAATLSRTDTAGSCSAHVVANTGEEADITYNLSLVGSDTNFVVTGATQTKAPGGGPPAH